MLNHFHVRKWNLSASMAPLEPSSSPGWLHGVQVSHIFLPLISLLAIEIYGVEPLVLKVLHAAAELASLDQYISFVLDL